MRKPKRFYTYIMANGPRSHVLYTGVTGNLDRRVFEHKNKILPGFTSRYNVTRLVYYESFAYPDDAIDREKEIKAWRRSKKIRLIESMNPHWYDLAAHWGEQYKPEHFATARQIPIRSHRRFAPRSLRAGSPPAGTSAGVRDDVFSGKA
ncbi:MAG TPA: GIY-YIG nuclease family protein [Terriglobales bacterium]